MSIIQTKKLTKIYGRDETAVVALENVNLRLEEGEFAAVNAPDSGWWNRDIKGGWGEPYTDLLGQCRGIGESGPFYSRWK